jgi:hypothetical protein
MAWLVLLPGPWQKMLPPCRHIFVDLPGGAYQSVWTLLNPLLFAAEVDFPEPFRVGFWPGGRIVSSAGFPNPHLLGVLLPGFLLE